MDLDADYSDDDDQIYFDKKEFIEHLSEIEEDNLFKINLLQNDEVQLETLKKNAETSEEKKKQEIREVEKNIAMLAASK